MESFLIFALLLGETLAANVGRTNQDDGPLTDVYWENCMMQPTIELTSLTVSPMPIRIPGTLKVSLSATIHREISNMEANVDIRRRTLFNLNMPLPCINDLGSCTYHDVCHKIQMEHPLVEAARQLFLSGGLPPQCPLRPTQVVVRDYLMDIPEIDLSYGLGYVVKGAITGEYKMEIQFWHSTNREQLGCIRMRLALAGTHVSTPSPPPGATTEPCTGWWCWFQ